MRKIYDGAFRYFVLVAQNNLRGESSTAKRIHVQSVDEIESEYEPFFIATPARAPIARANPRSSPLKIPQRASPVDYDKS